MNPARVIFFASAAVVGSVTVAVATSATAGPVSCPKTVTLEWPDTDPDCEPEARTNVRVLYPEWFTYDQEVVFVNRYLECMVWPRFVKDGHSDWAGRHCHVVTERVHPG